MIIFFFAFKQKALYIGLDYRIGDRHKTPLTLCLRYPNFDIYIYIYIYFKKNNKTGHIGL